MKTDYQHAVKEGIIDLGFQNPSKAAQLAAHHIDQVKVVHPIPEQGCINLDKACRRRGHVVSGEQVCVHAVDCDEMTAYPKLTTAAADKS